MSTSASTAHVAAGLAQVREQIEEATRAAGRSSHEVTLVAVTKRIGVDAIRAAIAAGQRRFGENYVQEALPKIEALGSDGIEWHLIGGLQANKAARATRSFALLHSVSSVSVAERVSREAVSLGRDARVLLQIKLGGGEQRAGVDGRDVEALARQLCALRGLLLDGVMGVASLEGEPRRDFAVLREQLVALRRAGLPQAPLREMSAGMSGDFRDAILEGATLVRIGTAIFGARRP